MFDFANIECKFPIYYMSINNVANRKIVSYVQDFKIRTINNFSENAENINLFIRKAIADGKTVIICLKKHQIRSIVKVLNMRVYESDFTSIKIGAVNLIEKEINHGFV